MDRDESPEVPSSVLDGSSRIEQPDRNPAEVDSPRAALAGLETNELVGQTGAHVPLSAAERDHAVRIRPPGLEVRRVLRVRKVVGVRPKGRAIERPRDLLAQGFVRPLAVVLGLEPIERALLGAEART